MKRCALTVLLCLAVPLLSAQQEPAVREIPYESVPNLLKFPAGLYLGEAAGVAVNSKGHIFVFTRSGQGTPAPTRESAFDTTTSPEGLDAWTERIVATLAWSPLGPTDLGRGRQPTRCD